MRKFYISGPIASPFNNFTREEKKEKFNQCERWINEHLPEWKVVNPLNVAACDDVDSRSEVLCNIIVEGTHTWECYLRYDLIAMLNCDGIVLLPGWEQSAGARLEAHVAQQIGLDAFFTDEDGRIVL